MAGSEHVKRDLGVRMGFRAHPSYREQEMQYKGVGTVFGTNWCLKL